LSTTDSMGSSGRYSSACVIKLVKVDGTAVPSLLVRQRRHVG
jgi:hypothetical protein